MVSTTLAALLVFDASAALGLVVVALACRPEGRAQLLEAVAGALGGGALGLAAALHGGHLGLPALDHLAVPVAGTAGAILFLVVLGRAVRRGRERRRGAR